MSELSLEDANQTDKETFVDGLGSVYETSQWVAERSWSEQPFSSIDDLHETMRSTVNDASREESYNYCVLTLTSARKLR